MQVGQVVRLAGQSSDADSCGTLVWAQAEEDVWWPAEALDPFEMPPGRSLPPAALAGKFLPGARRMQHASKVSDSCTYPLQGCIHAQG